MESELITDLRIDDLDFWEVTRVRCIETICRWIEAQPERMKAYDLATEDANRQLAEIARAAGVEDARSISKKSMIRIFRNWVNGLLDPMGSGKLLAAPRTWQTLVDYRKLSALSRQCRTAQPAFRNHLAALAAKHPRSLKSAVEELHRAWRNGENIPGYEGMNYKRNLPLPAGWSYDNLHKCLPDRRTLTITRQGMREAAPMLPQVQSTRVGLWPGAFVVFDDVWLDCLAWGPAPNGRMQLGRPLQIGCLDYYTGRRLCWGTKLRTMDESGQHLQLTEQEMLLILVDYLYNVGYSPRGTVLLVEHGTAAIRETVADRLYDITRGRVRVERSGIVGKQQVSAFEGRGYGNFKFKAALESWHNLLHNKMDDQPLHTGHDRKEPEKLWGIRREQEALVRAMNKGKLTPELEAALWHYAPSLYELTEQLVGVVESINHRQDHNLEGWAECGFVQEEFCLDGSTWQPAHTLLPPMAAAARALALTMPQVARQAYMSPDDAWQVECAKPENKLIRLTPTECLALLGTEMAFPLSHKGGVFDISAKRRHFANITYETRVRDARGYERELPYGPKYRGVFNPLSETLFVLDEKDRVLGEAPRADRFMRADPDAAARAMGRVAQRTAEITDRIAAHGQAGAIAADQAQIAWNAELLAIADNPDKRQTPQDRRVLKKLSAGQAPAPTDYKPLPETVGMGLPDTYGEASFS